MDAKLKHLEFIQSVIARLSNASFLFKGWSITLAGTLFAFAVVNNRSALVAIAIASTLLFWGLDGYYLWLERLFVELYAKVSLIPAQDIDFSMTVDKGDALRKWLRTCVRFHLLLFYGIMLIVEVVGILIVMEATSGP